MRLELDLKELHGTIRESLAKTHTTAVEGLTKEHEERLWKRLEGRNRFTRLFNRIVGRNRVVSFNDTNHIEEILSGHNPKLVIVRNFKVENEKELVNLARLLEKRRGTTKLVFLQKPGETIMKGDKGIDVWIQITKGADSHFITSYAKSGEDRKSAGTT